MTTRRTSAVDYSCRKWIYGPHVSKKNASYSVGAKSPHKWSEITSECLTDNSQNPLRKLKYITIDALTRPAVNSREIPLLIDKELRESKNLETVLLIHSVFIITFGKLFKENKDRTALCSNYKYFYDNVNDTLHKYTYFGSATIFVAPENFRSLNNKDTPRPGNIFSMVNASTIEELSAKIVGKSTVRSHPIQASCAIIDKVMDCDLKFGEIPVHPYFKPLSDTISCHCAFLKHKLIKTTDIETTHDDISKQMEISKGDYSAIRRFSHNFNNVPVAPIVITKYKFDENNVCSRKTYLSQFFEKCSLLFYKPTYIKPTNKDELFDAARDNFLIANKKCTGFHDSVSLNNLFRSSIANTTLDTDGTIIENLHAISNTPVFFIMEDNSRIYYDTYSGPAFQFYADIMKEMLEYKVFVPGSTLFTNDRYVLNMNFQIDVLDFYKNFPEESKTPDLKKRVTEDFFRCVGNLLRFAVANNIELPFKLSRIYIMQLFNIYDFTLYTPSRGYMIDRSLDYKLLLISIYLIEKVTPAHHKRIMSIFENPELLKNPTQELIEAFNTGDGGPIHMNGFNTLTNAPDDEPEYLYNEGSTIKTVLLKVIEFLYKTAFKTYFENQAKENEPLTKDFKINSAVRMLFEGFRSTKEFGGNNAKPLPSLTNISQLDFQHKLAYIRKADIYLSGFGITHETIKNILIPKIRITSLDHEELNILDVLQRKTITLRELENIENDNVYKNLEDESIKALIKKASLLYKVLLSSGKNIPINFINGYNEKLFGTKVPPEIMTITIEQENVNASQIAVPEGVTNVNVVVRSNKKITTIVTTSDKHVTIPRNAKATYTYVPVSSGHQKDMTDDDYHNEFIKFLLKFWSGSPNIGNSTYTVSYQSETEAARPNDLVIAGTCFLKISIIKIYKDENELYEDLVKSVIHTRFGELLGGEKTRRKAVSIKNK